MFIDWRTQRLLDITQKQNNGLRSGVDSFSIEIEFPCDDRFILSPIVNCRRGTVVVGGY